jgi:hypothetical protein
MGIGTSQRASNLNPTIIADRQQIENPTHSLRHASRAALVFRS